MTDELLTVAETAERLKVNEQTVRNWIDRGQLTATRLGDRRVRVTESDLARFLKIETQSSGKARRTTSGRGKHAREKAEVEAVIEQMVATSARLPATSLLGHELAESAGRLMVALQRPHSAEPADGNSPKRPAGTA